MRSLRSVLLHLTMAPPRVVNDGVLGWLPLQLLLRLELTGFDEVVVWQQSGLQS